MTTTTTTTEQYAANLRFAATVLDANNVVNATLFRFSKGLATEDNLADALDIWQNAVNAAKELLV